MAKLKFLIVLLFVTAFAFGQSPKREFRAAWIASVANIDWPSKPGLPVEEQKAQFIARLDSMKSLGCNAVIVQIRPTSDAFYDSKIEPWSRYLTGTQGVAPDPYYDPLTFMLEETHKRHMEFHAWFNPFRAAVETAKIPNYAKNHVTHTHPEWIIHYGGKSYIDPGIPDAREYVIKVICDVVKRYDIDAVHLDDYFYPYRIPGKEFGDANSFKKFGAGMSKDDWRRDNVNKFVESLNKSIKHNKSYVKFGISPFGVWRNKSKDTAGSDTKTGTSCYDELYSDIRLWMQNEWLDYVLPQLYWEHSHKVASFTQLMPWWYGHCYKRQVYYGLGVYRMAEHKNPVWNNVNELMWQMRDIRTGCPENSGFAFYSASSFDKTHVPIRDSIRQGITKYPAFPPPMKWLDSVPPIAPQLEIKEGTNSCHLTWKHQNPKKETITYVLYRFLPNESVNLDRTDRIIDITSSLSYTDKVAPAKGYTYVVTAMDRIWNESKMSNAVKH